MTQQFYKLTLEEAIALHQCGLISATALLYFFLRIRLAPGWKMTLHQREISEKLGISKPQFYRGIERLKKKGLIDWEAPNGVVITIGSIVEQDCNSLNKTTTVEQNCNSLNKTATVEQDCNSSEQNCNSLNKIATQVNKTATPTNPKPSSSKGSSGSPYSYQIFIKSLSDSARENFLNFVTEKIKDFPKPINDVQAWLAGLNQAGQYRWQVYYAMFQEEVGEAIAPSQDWENHPRWKEAIAAMRTGVPRFIVLGQPGCEDMEKSTRQAMADYAEANNLIWGDK